MFATAISSSSFRENLKSTFEKVVDARSPFLITRKSQEDIVIMPVHEYEGLIETVHLTRSATNADRLFSALDRAKKSEFNSHSLIDIV